MSGIVFIVSFNCLCFHDHQKVFICILMKVFEHIYKCYFDVFVLCCIQLNCFFSEHIAIGFLTSGGDILSLFFMFVLFPGVMTFEVFLGIDIWSCLCWVGVLFFGYRFPLQVPARCGGCRVPDSQPGMVHLRSLVESTVQVQPSVVGFFPGKSSSACGQGVTKERRWAKMVCREMQL